MSTTKMALLFAFCSLLFLSGCSDDAGNTQQDFYLIASEKTLPANMHELAFKRKEIPYFQYLVRKAKDQSEFEDFWNLYEFEDKAPKLEFNDGSAYFIGLHESGSCPFKVEKIEPNSDNITITIAHPDGNCTTNASPRTFVVQFDKVDSKELESVIIIEGGIETSVAIEN